LSLIAEAAKQLVHELSCRFPAHHLMEALGLVYPQYWLTEDCKENFDKHMLVIKSQYYQPKTTHTKRGRPAKKCRKGQVQGVVATANDVDNNALNLGTVQVSFLATSMCSNFREINILCRGLLHGFCGLTWIRVYMTGHWY
jgi:hypothetical protein